MKITSVEVFAVEGLNQPLLFCAIRTDQGIVGYSEFGEGRLAHGMTGLIRDLSDQLLGKDPRAVEAHYIQMIRSTRMAYAGATWQALAGIELALWDIKGKALDVPVYELLGGPTHADISGSFVQTTWHQTRQIL